MTSELRRCEQILYVCPECRAEHWNYPLPGDEDLTSTYELCRECEESNRSLEQTP